MMMDWIGWVMWLWWFFWLFLWWLLVWVSFLRIWLFVGILWNLRIIWSCIWNGIVGLRIFIMFWWLRKFFLILISVNLLSWCIINGCLLFYFLWFFCLSYLIWFGEFLMEGLVWIWINVFILWRRFSMIFLKIEISFFMFLWDLWINGWILIKSINGMCLFVLSIRFFDFFVFFVISELGDILWLCIFLLKFYM